MTLKGICMNCTGMRTHINPTSTGDAAFLQVAKRVDKLFMTHLHLVCD